jgi:hypothetical protein
MTVSTATAGGTGLGSTRAVIVPVTISAADTMGNPTIGGLASLPSRSSANTVVISGVTYYTSGTVLTFAVRAFVLNNIFNVLSFYGSPPVFNYISITDTLSSTPTTDSTSNLQYQSGASYPDFPASSGSNATYYNKTAVTRSLSAGNLSGSRATAVRVDFALLNALSKTATGRLYPASQLVGYVSAWNSTLETSIPLNQGSRTTISGISSQTRMSIRDAASNPPINPSLSDIVAFVPNGLTNYDGAYNPFDENFHAATTTLATSLNTSYVLPATPSLKADGTKYFVLRAVTTDALKQFTLRFGGGSYTTNITNVYVKWVGGGGATETAWYNASADWQSATGCQNGVSGFNGTASHNDIWQIRINTAADATYTGGGFIYFNVQFTGVIPMNQIVIT